MPSDGSDDAVSEDDLPSFADLVRELGIDVDDIPARRPTDPDDALRPSDAPAGANSAGPSAADPSDPPIESRWRWAGDSRSDDVAPGRADEFDVEDDDALTTLDAKSNALLELIGDAANVLLVGPEGCAAENEICGTLTTAEGAGRSKRLLITTRYAPTDRLNAIRHYGNDDFDETVIVNVGDQVRSGRDPDGTLDVEGSPLTIENVTDPNDLTRLGLAINKHLRDGSEGTEIEICFHTLASMFQQAGTEKVFRFLHILRGRVRSAGARAHYHVHPDEVDEETIATLVPLFDHVIRYEEDGPISVDS